MSHAKMIALPYLLSEKLTNFPLMSNLVVFFFLFFFFSFFFCWGGEGGKIYISVSTAENFL